MGLVTPLYARVGRKLIDSIRHPTVVQNDSALRVFSVRPVGVREAIAQALRNEDRKYAETNWSDPLSSTGTALRRGAMRFGNRLIETGQIQVAVPPHVAFIPTQRIGGSTGWYYGDWLWTVRGWLDLLAGGVGMKRGRRNRDRLKVGEPVDCWRVEAIEPGFRLQLAAEMKLPGRAWLEFEVAGDGNGSLIRQTAIFDPIGLRGLLYWYSVYPMHQLVFAGMLRGIARAAEEMGAKK